MNENSSAARFRAEQDGAAALSALLGALDDLAGGPPPAPYVVTLPDAESVEEAEDTGSAGQVAGVGDPYSAAHRAARSSLGDMDDAIDDAIAAFAAHPDVVLLTFGRESEQVAAMARRMCEDETGRPWPEGPGPESMAVRRQWRARARSARAALRGGAADG